MAGQAPLQVAVRAERHELTVPFRISRGDKTHAEVVVVELTTTTGARAAGEGVPYARYGESVASVLSALSPATGQPANEASLTALSRELAGAAKNALSSALFALRHPARCRVALSDFDLSTSARTVALDLPARMAEAARDLRCRWVKVKLQGDDLDLERLQAVRAAQPDTPLWLDANEGFTRERFGQLTPHLGRLGVELIEQPFPVADEAVAAALGELPAPLCADESFHTAADAERLARLGYRAVNVKLDKAGGIEAAIEAAERAHAVGLSVAFGCMVSTELSIAAAWVAVKEIARCGIPVPFLDLDGATFLRAPRSLADTGFGAG